MTPSKRDVYFDPLVTFTASPASGTPRACSSCFISTPGTLAMPPSAKSAATMNMISMVWLAGSALSVLRRSDHPGLSRIEPHQRGVVELWKRLIRPVGLRQTVCSHMLRMPVPYNGVVAADGYPPQQNAHRDTCQSKSEERVAPPPSRAGRVAARGQAHQRSEEHLSELQSL